MKVVCAGDCGVDRYPSIGLDRAGGITLNFAVHARRLFDPDDEIVVVSAVGNDPESRIVLEAIDALPLEARLATLEGETSIQLIDLEPSGEKIFVEYRQGVLGDLRVSDDQAAAIRDADLLVAPHYRQIDGFFASVVGTPSRGLRAFDFADISETPSTATMERYLGALDVAFFGLTREHGELIAALEGTATRADKLFIVTLGAGGSLALSRAGRIEVPAAPVERVVDTTGAGDTFAAAFLASYTKTRDVKRSLERGAEEAARTIARIGAF